MPFVMPWRNFEDGDLVYGVETKTGEGRREFIDTYANGCSVASTIDEFAPLQRIFKGSKEASKPDQKSFSEALGKHPKYNEALKGISIDDAEDNMRSRRKCKGGLYWASKIEGKHVHFVLDGIDQAAVVNKNYSGRGQKDSQPGASEKIRSITGSELRWAYRNRTDENVKNSVQFWHGSVQVPPPWEGDGARMWSAYKPTSKHVHDADALDEVADAMDGGDRGGRTGCCIVC